jgi:hypothetical protein
VRKNPPLTRGRYLDRECAWQHATVRSFHCAGVAPSASRYVSAASAEMRRSQGRVMYETASAASNTTGSKNKGLSPATYHVHKSAFLINAGIVGVTCS